MISKIISKCWCLQNYVLFWSFKCIGIHLMVLVFTVEFVSDRIERLNKCSRFEWINWLTTFVVWNWLLVNRIRICTEYELNSMTISETVARRLLLCRLLRLPSSSDSSQLKRRTIIKVEIYNINTRIVFWRLLPSFPVVIVYIAINIALWYCCLWGNTIKWPYTDIHIHTEVTFFFNVWTCWHNLHIIDTTHT